MIEEPKQYLVIGSNLLSLLPQCFVGRSARVPSLFDVQSLGTYRLEERNASSQAQVMCDIAPLYVSDPTM